MIEALPEFSRRFALDTIGTTPREISITAEGAECDALAIRFGLVAVKSLSASLTLKTQGKSVTATGVMTAEVTQSCVASAADVHASMKELVEIHFVAALASDDAPDEVELDESDCDVAEHDGQAVDLGEAIAQSMGLALNPFPRAAGAAEILKIAGVVSEEEVQTGAFAGLKGLLGRA
jgi:uncharacterized metal-binding protein YceD (DUF177 family)